MRGETLRSNINSLLLGGLMRKWLALVGVTLAPAVLVFSALAVARVAFLLVIALTNPTFLAGGAFSIVILVIPLLILALIGFLTGSDPLDVPGPIVIFM
jgi:hypothetical protein